LYQSVEIAGSTALEEPGLPEIPVIRKFIAVPACDRVELKAVARDVRTIPSVAIRPSAANSGATRLRA
jgi:hypothetical protein